MMKCVARTGVKSEMVELTEEEITARLAEDTAYAEHQATLAPELAIQAQIKAKWKNTDALINDILDRGVDIVKQERDAILRGE